MRTGIVLVGGEARRAGGVEKYFFEVCGQTFIDRLLGTLREVVDEIVIVARDREQCTRFAEYQDVRCIEDLRKGMGPIGGLHAGALAAHGDELFVVACDMPCINGKVIEGLFRMMEGYDAAIPCWNREMLEPLHAVYRRSALLEYLREHESRSLRAMIEALHPRYVPAESFRPVDPDLLTFININHISDLEEFRAEIEHRL
ncbi:molybdopterin-guanine dinucleotide biosynthesis protein A [Methanofollis sp. W23]|uniref:molybdenum cofactor guanylyltransferase n=1 Tax=Methanofollis sp. W23 TaxID=2817849 RepID=UPI001AE85BE8|nr:molybdenum cofactor guanylyltransferase [Methanofollis sp. W23]MBP2144805.1 molybdopterin-guanine dinucleotide biosynthesis protein A [Methanofollis sp. W23]